MLPAGYTLWNSDDDHVVVVADFSQFNKVAPEEIEHNGRRYKRGPLEPLPRDAANYCSARRYDIIGKPINREVLTQAANIIQTLQNLENSNADSGDVARELTKMIVDAEIDYDAVADLRDILDMAVKAAV